MLDLVKAVAASCDMSEQDAIREIQNEADILTADGYISARNLDDFCYALGIEMDSILDNPEMLLAFL